MPVYLFNCTDTYVEDSPFGATVLHVRDKSVRVVYEHCKTLDRLGVRVKQFRFKAPAELVVKCGVERGAEMLAVMLPGYPSKIIITQAPSDYAADAALAKQLIIVLIRQSAVARFNPAL